MAEFEKGLVKKKFGDIGKEEIDGKVIVETPEDGEDKFVLEEAEWQEVKSTMIFDFEEKEMDFGRCKATNWKGNKRITLPKGGSTQMEAYLEVRRKEASKIFDECMELLGDGFEKTGMDNLTTSEKRGLNSLKRKVKEGVLIICQTDKSGRFCVMSREDYRMAGSKHTSKDREITNKENEEIQRALNGHMIWWGDIWNLGTIGTRRTDARGTS